MAIPPPTVARGVSRREAGRRGVGLGWTAALGERGSEAHKVEQHVREDLARVRVRVGVRVGVRARVRVRIRVRVRVRVRVTACLCAIS